MRVGRFALIPILSLISLSGFAKDVYLTIGGSVGAFRTDMRIFNPSTTKDIQVQAYLLATGGVDNTAVAPKTITVPHRQMVIYDDVLTSLFQASGLAGIRLSSTDDFVATQRIYATSSSGTLGQFLQGLDATTALKGGVIIQLKSSNAFRTNLGVVNPNAGTANVQFRLYDKNNAIIGQGKTLALPPFAVIAPTNITGFFSDAGSADLSDAWVGFSADQPIFAYGSVIDNASTDPTYVAAVLDSGAPAYVAPPAPSAKTLTVVEHNNSIVVTPSDTINVGDTVTVKVSVFDGPHGFALTDPNGVNVIPPHGATNPGTTYTETFTVTKQGTYGYFCTNSGCGAHTGMDGTLVIGDSSGDVPHPGY